MKEGLKIIQSIIPIVATTILNINPISVFTANIQRIMVTVIMIDNVMFH